MPANPINSDFLRKAVSHLPYLYFIGLFLMLDSGWFSWMLILPFFVQLLFRFRYVDIFLGVLMSLGAFWFLLAYLSDLNKIVSLQSQSIQFISGGAAFLVSLFGMTFLLFRNEVKMDKKLSM
jgi:hypothetical protein